MSSSSSSGNWRYDVFPSFSGGDVRKSFLSHLLDKLKRKLIITFIDHGIERSRQIGPELLSAIRESRISIVVFSENYASSTWCLNELVEIHKCYKELDQVVIPIFYGVDPSHVRWQEGDFGERFEKTCDGKTYVEKERWMQALTVVANLAGEDSKNWSDEANMIEHIAKDVFNKLMTPSNDFGDFVGIEAHLEALNKILCLESEEVRILGIVGPSGIGKSTIGRALYSQLSSRFYHHAFVISYKRKIQEDDYSMKLRWEEQLLSEISHEKDIKMSHLGVVKKMLMHKKVLIIVDDVDDFELVKTLVEQTRCVGSGSRILVITQDWKLLKSQKIDLIYEVELPMEDLALKIFCQSAFGQNSPPYGFMKLAFEVAKLSGNLPLGLSVLGSSLRGMDKEEWVEMLPRFRNGLDGKIEKTLRVSYNRLDGKDQELFLYIACLFRGYGVNRIKDLLGDGAKIGLKILADKSLIRIVPSGITVEMHSLLQMLGKEIVRAESINDPGKRRFLMDAEEICDVLTDNTGTENVEAIDLNMSNINKHLFIDENSFQGIRNLKFLKIFNYWSRETREGILFSPPVTGGGRLFLPRGLDHFPRKIRSLRWDEYPSKCLPFNFKADYLVELELIGSKLEKLWEGTQLLQSLKKMDMSWSEDLKEIPVLSKAINLDILNLRGCTSLVTLPSSIRNLNKLRVLDMRECSELKVLPTDVNLESLEFWYLSDCKSLVITSSVRNLNKLWSLNMDGCESLVEIPDLSKATILCDLEFRNCKNLVMLPSSIMNLKNLKTLNMEGCTLLEVLPTDINLVNLLKLSLRGCSKLSKFPQISTRIVNLYLDDTAIGEIPSWIEKRYALHKLTMSRCMMLKVISPNILKLKYLVVDFPANGRITTMLPQTSLQLNNCFNLDRDAQELILQSYFFCTVLPGGEVPLYFTHRASGTSLIMPLSEISLSQENLGFKACIVVGPPTHPKDRLGDIGVRWCFRGKKGVIPSRNKVTSCIEDHLVLLFFVFPEKEVYESPSEWKNNVLQLEFYYHNHSCPCNNFGPDRNTRTCPLSCHRIKGCGVRFVNIPPSRFLNKLDASLEENVYYQEFGESDEESDRRKKRMRMTVTTSEEPSNIQTAVNSELISPNLELSLGLVGASAVVSSRSNVPSPSRSFHGDDGPSLSLSLSSFDPCLALYFDPMIIDQQDTGTPSEDHSLSPQLVDYFSHGSSSG